MRLIVDGRTLLLREIIWRDDIQIKMDDTFIDMGVKKIRDLNKDNAILITTDGDIPRGMEPDDVPCFKKYKWMLDTNTGEFMKVR